MPRTTLALSVLLLSAAALATACSSNLRVYPVSPPTAKAVKAVVVELGPEVVGKKASILQNYKVPELMGTAISQSMNGGGAHQLLVTITKFRTGSYGPTFMHGVAQLVDASGAPVGPSWEGHAQSMVGSRASRVQGCAQLIVNKLVNQFAQMPDPSPAPAPAPAPTTF